MLGLGGFFSSRNENMRKQISPLMLKEIPGGLGGSQSAWTKGADCGAATQGSVRAAVLGGWQEPHCLFISKGDAWQQIGEHPQHC